MARYLDTLSQAAGKNGQVLVGATLGFFEAGTLIKLDTFQDEELTIANANPVVADGEGRFPDIFLKPQKYFIEFRDAGGTLKDSQDNVTGAVIGSNSLENIAALTALAKSTLLDGDSFPVDSYSIRGDGGGGRRYFFDAASTETANGGTIIITDEGGTGRWKSITDDVINVLMFGTPVDGSTSGSTEIQATIDSIATASSAIERGAIEFPVITNNYVIDTQLELDKKNIDFIGNNNALKWEGNNTTAMIRVTDSTRCHFNNLILLGDFTTPPTAALFFEGISGATNGSNENIVIDGCVLGRRYTLDTTTGGSADATPAGRLQAGIVIGGLDGNNDEYSIKNTQVHSCDGAAIDFQNTNSIWSTLQDVLMNDNDIGLKQGANIIAYNIVFNRNVTVDIVGQRQTVMSIFGMNAENSKVFIESNAGASFFVDGGKLLRNDAVASFFFNFNAGGHMSLKNLLIQNAQPNVGDIIRYKGGSGGGSVKVEGCDIVGGDDRDTWEIDTGQTGFVDIPIDIQHGRFHFKTTHNYMDREIDPPSVDTERTSLVSTTAESVFGDFFHFAFQLDIQDMQATVAYDTTATMRARFFNSTGGTIDLASGRCRWMNLGDFIKARNNAVLDVASLANGDGETLTIPVPGARLGDYAVFGVGSTFKDITTTAYVSADDTVSLHFHNATGGTFNPPSQTFHAAILEEFGSFKGGEVHTPVLIADGANATPTDITVPGAQLGAHVFVAYTKDLKGLIVTASVSAADTVRIIQANRTGAGVTLDAGSFKVMVAF